MLNLKVTLPCKPVVWQYLQNKYGAALILPEDDWIKLMLYNMLQRKSAEQDTKIKLQFYTKEAAIPIDLKYYELYGDALTKTAIRAINNRIEDIVHQQLYQYLEFYVHVCHYQLNTAIEMFQQQYNFPPEIYTHDAIKKYYQRSIQPYLVLQKFTSVNVPFKRKRNHKRAA